MQSKKSAPLLEGKNYIILAIPAGENPFEVCTAIKEMEIPLYVAKEMSEIEDTLSDNPGALGAVVAQKFLGDDAPMTFKRIQSIDPELPIVIVASDTNIAFETTMRQMGIFYYLLSPFDREEFLNMVHSLHSHYVKRNRATESDRLSGKLAEGATR